ncbi:MAG: carbon-nitrogen hydrolase family protein [Granulosicoccaceae bacterium]
MSGQHLELLACQLAIPQTPDAATRNCHLQASTARVAAQLRKAAVDLVVLPELSSIDYSRLSFEALDQVAEGLDGPSYQQWSKLAREHLTTIVYGFARRVSEGECRICSAVVGPDGVLIGYYDKLHLAQFGASMEQEYFRAGGELLVFEVQGFRIAPIICFDIRPPELCRQLVLQHGVDLILHMGAYYRDPSFSSWHAFAQARAVENQVYFLSLNRAGEQYGDSLFVPPWIDDHIHPTDFPDHDEAFLRLRCEREAMDTARRNYAFLAERLPSYDLPLNQTQQKGKLS